MKSYDPKLREAMTEIEEVLKKHDIGGYIALTSKTHSEFRVAIDIPTWSVVRYIRDGEAVHIKLYTASRHADTEATVHMIASIRDQSVLAFGQTEQIMNKIEEQIKVVHVPFGRDGITNDDRS
jgi:hypothetical protein